jgi:hypothetical protein
LGCSVMVGSRPRADGHGRVHEARCSGAGGPRVSVEWDEAEVVGPVVMDAPAAAGGVELAGWILAISNVLASCSWWPLPLSPASCPAAAGPTLLQSGWIGKLRVMQLEYSPEVLPFAGMFIM